MRLHPGGNLLHGQAEPGAHQLGHEKVVYHARTPWHSQYTQKRHVRHREGGREASVAQAVETLALNSRHLHSRFHEVHYD